jgi:hypothetical protein
MAAQVVEIADTVREGKKVRISQKDGTTEEHGIDAGPAFRATVGERGDCPRCYTLGAKGVMLLRGTSPRQRRWGTPLAAWRDPAETQAADPHPPSIQTNRFDCGNGPARARAAGNRDKLSSLSAGDNGMLRP